MFEFLNLNTTHKDSLMYGFIIFCITGILLFYYKPKIVTIETDGYDDEINWINLLLISLLISVVSSIFIFLKNQNNTDVNNVVKKENLPVGIAY